MLEINNLSFSYDKTPVLRHLSITIEQGQYFALAGMNGVGKTTLIKLVLDLIRAPARNSILINGISSQKISSRGQLVFLPEKFKVNSYVTAHDYFKLIAGVYHQKLDVNRIKYLCRKLDFPVDKLKQPANRYSKGMLQKIGLIGCLMLDVSYLILDEPLSGLDPKARIQVKNLLLEERQRGPKTLLYSTHMLSDVDELCDAFGILHQGKLQFIGTPGECMSLFNSDNLERAFITCIERVDQESAEHNDASP
jgi:ABC-2 type transport system ATP-binding protein